MKRGRKRGTPKALAKITNQAELVKLVRSLLGLTQAELAEMLHASRKSVESYEQGWRHIPSLTMSVLLSFICLHKRQPVHATPCWKRTRCPPSVYRRCVSYQVTHGQWCWLVGSHVCEQRRRYRGRMRPCIQCVVVQEMLKKAR